MKSFSTIVVILLLVILIAPPAAAVLLAFSSGSYIVFPPAGLSLHWFASALKPSWVNAAGNSLIVALVSSTMCTFLATTVAYVLRQLNVRAQSFSFLALVPLIFPSIVFAVGFYSVFGEGGTLHLILAHFIFNFPLTFAIIFSGFSKIPSGYEKAAMSLGANHTMVLRRVIVPLASSAVLLGAFLTFILSWDDSVIVLFVTSPTFNTLPKKMWLSMRFETNLTMSAISLIMIITSLILVFVYKTLSLKGTKYA